jgi:tetratricopeptide (TPR) repeat protein
MVTRDSEDELSDAKRVDQAVAAIKNGNIVAANALLLGVISNTPATYSNESENPDGTLAIRFWDQQSFIHYALWQKEQNSQRGVSWVANAYPRAHYYMGFLCVKTRQFQQALEYLERGHSLEPTNPKFNFEKAQALVHSGEKEKALALYESVTEIGPHVSAFDIAMARRGRGFVLIELGRLDEAREAFQSSLEIEPDNEIALNELKYIDHLQQGGAALPGEAIPTQVPSLSGCALCGMKFMKGLVVSVHGVPRTICNNCQRKLTKKWWQFWK